MDSKELAGDRSGEGTDDVPAVIRLVGFFRRFSGAELATLVVVATASIFVWCQLQPNLLLAPTTPAGGDMGAHVWGPAFLRDHLLPAGRLSGWAPDWYAGFPAYHFYMVVPSLLIVALDVVLPYGIAFKLVSVSGLVAMPIAGWALARLARAQFPVPALVSVATVPFIFDQSFTIFGGNAASTLAGEFAFSLSLTVALVFLGLVLRGLDDRRHRALAAATLALCVLLHLIPALFALGGAGVILLWRRNRGQAFGLLTVGVVGGLLTSFWTVPFVLRRPFLNDMGWTKQTTYLESLFPGRIGTFLTELAGGDATADINGDLTLVVFLAAIGIAVSIVGRRRLGLVLGTLSIVVGVAFVLLPEGRLWNARLLPFWYLCLYLLAALAAAELAVSLAMMLPRRWHALERGALVVSSTMLALTVLVWVGLPLRSLPFGAEEGSSYRWAIFSTQERSFVPDWARWNFSGYERKETYPEYQALVETMAGTGRTLGCGRAMWEYGPDLNRFGTTMALMLLPYWTDGCIGSMEGLFFESSPTTPFHFLNQSELSSRPSRPQRDLAYGQLDVGAGVDHLQLLGVRYYMAFSPEAVQQAEREPELTEVASSGSWHVFEVSEAEMVEPLDIEPVVSAEDGGEEWQEAALRWYLDPTRADVLLAAHGPASWETASRGEPLDRVRLEPARVSNTELSVDRISFDVDRVGVPVLVKTSYFPNWEATGAAGPYRVAPNLMVVIPSERSVVLSYGTTSVEWLAWLMTAVGVVGLVRLARRSSSTPSTPLPPRELEMGETNGGSEPVVAVGTIPESPDRKSPALDVHR